MHDEFAADTWLQPDRILDIDTGASYGWVFKKGK
jgi:hypothetical protein